ncbi:helix-turn-helix transcriptional regulator [Paraburkholderia sediminicola]|uniref:helix-turn-helix transcriptional regulator n=1 Tax=Paraburkholderia sediminicola TaxID=458836 RepID=UPI0038B71642
MQSSASAAVVTKPFLQVKEQAYLPHTGFTRWSDLKRFVPLSRETVRLRELAGRFPRRVLLTERTAAWRNEEIHEWLADPAGYMAKTASEDVQH